MKRRAFLAGAASLPVVAAIGPAVAETIPYVAPSAEAQAFLAYVDAIKASMAQPSRLLLRTQAISVLIDELGVDDALPHIVALHEVDA